MIKQHTPEWLTEKLKYIGGSEIYSLVWHYCKDDLIKAGVDVVKEKPFMSPLQLFVKVKHGLINNDISVVNSQFGLEMEACINNRLNLENDNIIVTGSSNFVANDKINLMACSPDGAIKIVENNSVPDFDKTCMIDSSWGDGMLEDKTTPFGFNFQSDFGAKFQYLFQLQYNMMATGLKWGMLALSTPKEEEYDNDFFKGQIKEKAVNRNFAEIAEYYNLFTYVYPALKSMQEIILKSLKLFQEDLDKDNYAGVLCQEEDLEMRVKDKKALSLAFPKHYGDLNLCQEEDSEMSMKDKKALEAINNLLNERMVANVEEKKIKTEKTKIENELILATSKYNKVLGKEYRMIWTSNGQTRFYKNK